MAGRVAGTCDVCQSDAGFTKEDDGFFYCVYCRSQADGIRDTGIDEEGVFSQYTPRFSRARPSRAPVADTEPVSQVKSTMSQHLDRSHFLDNMEEDVNEPTEPRDFASSLKNFSYDDYYTEIRSRYLKGFQLMMQLQSQALVEKFGVSPLIVGLVGPLWFRFLASTKVMAGGWADQAVQDSETQMQGEADEFQPSANNRWEEPVNIYGKRLAYVWYKSLKHALPIPCSLAISLLVCHLAREPILPTDILKWAHEGKLPYISACFAIEKQLGSCTEACPITVNRMFRPVQVISSQKLEAMAAGIAQRIGLKLPPVNFYSIASRYLRQLSLPTEKILPSACHIYEWSMPSELYLSASEARIPTRAYVMSILIVAIRNLFDINGYGVWESSLSDPSCSSSRVKNGDNESRSHLNETASETADDVSSSHDVKPSGTKDRDLSAVELLQILDAKYYELSNNTHEYSSDLATYLQYCKDVVFSRPSFEDADDEKLIDELWAFYQNNKGAQTPDENETSSDDPRKKEDDEARNRGSQSSCSTSRRSGDSDSGDDCSKCSTDRVNCCHREQDSACSSRTPKGSAKEKALRLLKLDMEENHFCYLSPRMVIKRRDYLHYSRKRKEVLIYAVHADYYLLLRCCAKVAEVETRIMHIAVLRLERRLKWLEKRIEQSLFHHSNPGSGCEFCEVDEKDTGNDTR
ncbi:TATA box-binding protein-associated factor RNA polymerase I subunit B [Salvia divinorum]|uniref:TATA box-binding protein-associated factor RNA polymerase I subunit B n=1 Tax=Salvia divinorum TaxID=28513 RepID=A0ABD1GUQ4_SALDI